MWRQRILACRGAGASQPGGKNLTQVGARGLFVSRGKVTPPKRRRAAAVHDAGAFPSAPRTTRSSPGLRPPAGAFGMEHARLWPELRSRLNRRKRRKQRGRPPTRIPRFQLFKATLFPGGRMPLSTSGRKPDATSPVSASARHRGRRAFLPPCERDCPPHQ